MNDQAPSVSDLVTRFQLRRRASTDAFRDGVHLARSGFVTLTDVATDTVSGEVNDPQALPVVLRVEAGGLVGRCRCPAAADGVCRHQVAVAHELWVRNRRHPDRI